MATTKTINATLSGYKNETGVQTNTVSISNGPSGKATATKYYTPTSTGGYPPSSAWPPYPSEEEARKAITGSMPHSSSYRSSIGSWNLDQGTTEPVASFLVGNAYSDEIYMQARGYSYSVSQGGGGNVTSSGQYILTSSRTATVTRAYGESKRTSNDTVITFNITPSLIDTSYPATLTITHTAPTASDFAFYAAVGSNVDTFLGNLTNVTYQTVAVSGTSTTITLSDDVLTTLKNLGSDSIVINIGRFRSGHGVKSSYAGTASIESASLSFTVSTVRLTYNANGGTGAPANDYNAQPDSPYTLSSTVPTRTGYTFLGWSKESSATTASYSAGGTITLTGDTVLYAVWEAKTYTITYNANGGSGSASASATYGSSWTTHSGSGFTRSGYNLVGWAASASNTAAYELGKAQSTWLTDANVTLYAVWAIKTYTVTYQSDSNTYAGTPATETKTHGTALTLKGVTFYRHGYTQTGWSTSVGGAKAYNVGGSYTENASAILYPFWTENAKHTITLDANGGVFTDGSSAKTFQLAEGAFYGDNLVDPTKGTLTFSGWHTESGQKVNSESIFTATANQTLTAQWGVVPVVIIQKRDGVIKLVKDRSGKALTKGIETS